jgi:hypothetical protein
LKSSLQIIRRFRRRFRAEDGGTLAELAILLPFLVVMAAAVTEVGRFFQTYTTLAKGVRSSARYLSNQKSPYSVDDMNKATSLAVCGKLVCAGGDELAAGMVAGKVCIEDQPASEMVRVSIPRVAKACDNGNIVPYNHQPIFNMGELLNSQTFTFAPLIDTSITMPYVNED